MAGGMGCGYGVMSDGDGDGMTGWRGGMQCRDCNACRFSIYQLSLLRLYHSHSPPHGVLYWHLTDLSVRC